MDSILKRTKTTVILTGIALLVLGIAVFVNPAGATLAVTLIVGWTLVILGVYTLSSCFVHRLPVLSQMDLFFGLLELIPGICILVWPGFFVSYLFLVLGIFVLVTGINDIMEAVDEHRIHVDYWGQSLAIGILTLVMGVLVIIAPFAMAQTVMMVYGIALVFDGVTEIVTGIRMPSKVSGS